MGDNILAFKVSMPGYRPLEKDSFQVVVYGFPDKMAKEFGVHRHTFFSMKQDASREELEGKSEDWYVLDIPRITDNDSREPVTFRERVALIAKNWKENGVKFHPPMPDFTNPELQENIQDAIMGTNVKNSQRPDYSYPDPNTVR